MMARGDTRTAAPLETADPRELLDGSGQILARAGDHVRAGGGFLAAGAVEGFSVCGDFEVVPAG